MFFGEQKLNSSESSLHERALAAAGRFRAAQAEMLEVVREVDRVRLYARFGLGSTFAYCLEKLALSEDMAVAFIGVARKAEEVPALQVAVDEGLSISKARKVARVITVENQEAWIEKAKALPYRELEREIARELPEQAVVERVVPVASARVKVQVGLDDAVLAMLREAQDLAGAASLEETLAAVLTSYLKKKKPKPRANSKPNLRAEKIPAAVLQEVRKRDQRSCQAVLPGGKRCGARRWVEVHHIHPRAAGGDHRLENLITLCSAHHRQTHSGTSRDG